MGLEPCEAHWGGQNTTAPRREAQGQDRSAAREDQACAPDYPVILPGPRCRLYYRLLSKGGVGKSTLSTNIACALAGDRKVTLVDADDHQATSWWGRKAPPPVPVISA